MSHTDLQTQLRRAQKQDCKTANVLHKHDSKKRPWPSFTVKAMVVLGLLKWRAPSCLILLTLLTQWSLLLKHTSDSQLQQIQNRCLVWFGGRGRPQKCDRFYIDGCALSKQIQIGKWMDGWMDEYASRSVCKIVTRMCIQTEYPHRYTNILEYTNL